VFFLVTRGLHLSVEFTGGTVMEVSYTQPADLAQGARTVGQPGLPRRAGAKLSAPRAM
jgi:preprotein translocase subunit SecF